MEIIQYGQRVRIPHRGQSPSSVTQLPILTALHARFPTLFAHIIHEKSQDVGYHNCFPWGFETEYFDRPFESALDHILVSNDLGCAVKRFERYSPDYYFPISDHSAAYVDMEL